MTVNLCGHGSAWEVCMHGVGLEDTDLAIIQLKPGIQKPIKLQHYNINTGYKITFEPA